MPSSKSTCSIGGCARPVLARVWCSMHYGRWLTRGNPEAQSQRDPLRVRFWRMVDKSGDCWEWTGTTTVHGYGQSKVAGKNQSAHRTSYELLVGPIPEGLQIDHLCRNRSCVNPSHMEPVTQQENMRRGDGAGAKNASKTHCKWGHEFSDENTYMQGPGGKHRGCLACRAIRNEKRRQ